MASSLIMAIAMSDTCFMVYLALIIIAIHLLVGSANENELRIFFQQHYFQIFAVISDTFSACEVHFKYKGVHMKLYTTMTA